MTQPQPIEPRNCAHCNVAMTPGYVPDITYGGIARSTWVKWPPVRNWLGGHKHKRGVPLIAHRCPQCATVEFTAPYEPDPPST